MPIDEQDNLELDVDVENPDGSQDNTGDSGEGSEDFLTVNERTRFKSKEDAIRSFNEAGTRIAQLSGWEKEMARYGVTDPQTAAALLQELAQAREQQRLAKEAESKAKTAASTASVSTDDEVLTKEDADALKWLKKHAPRLGFVPQDELKSTVDALKAQIDELKNGSSYSAQQEQERIKSERVDSGREAVKGWMTEQKIADNPDGEKQLVIESLIRDWVNADEERVKRFYASGASAKNLIKEGFDKAVKVLGWGKAAVNPASAAYAQSKGNAMARNGKRLPQNGSAKKGNAQHGDPSNVRRDASGKRDYIGEAHNAAFEAASKHFTGHSSE